MNTNWKNYVMLEKNLKIQISHFHILLSNVNMHSNTLLSKKKSSNNRRMLLKVFFFLKIFKI